MLDEAKKWMERDPDPKTRNEILELEKAKDFDEIAARFAGRLSFGTAGLRGVLGAGPMRMNRLVVRETSAGLGQYLLQNVNGAQDKGVVVGYDGRLMSREFAEDTARVLTGLGIKVYLSEDLCPTPIVAFALKHFGAAAGVMVTASHNPPEYNGYKVYWGNGAQIVPPHDTGIAKAIDEASRAEIPFADDLEFERLADFFGREVDDIYMAEVRKLSLVDASESRKDFAIAYTPMHGVGSKLVERALKESGFEKVVVVPEQRRPDGLFPTVNFPNPEEPGAMDLVCALAESVGANLALASDPDADRLAVAARTGNGEFKMLRGDQVGVLFGYECLRRKAGHAVATTIVSSQLLGVMAKKFGAPYYETLTGFKWIANEAMEHPDTPFAFGYEEALGYTVGELVRDKDGVSAAKIFAELAVSWADEGRDVWAQIERIDREFGIYLTGQRSLHYDEENQALKNLNSGIRANLPWTVAGVPVDSITDLEAGTRQWADGRVETLNLPKSDVLTFWLTGGARIIVRPSGTEPKIKCYYEIVEPVAGDYEDAKTNARKTLETLIESHQQELAALAN